LLNELPPVRTRLWWCFFDVHMNSPLEGIFVALTKASSSHLVWRRIRADP
jgi:hypothetical protein